jgi:hypothetical protein
MRRERRNSRSQKVLLGCVVTPVFGFQIVAHTAGDWLILNGDTQKAVWPLQKSVFLDHNQMSKQQKNFGVNS